MLESTEKDRKIYELVQENKKLLEESSSAQASLTEQVSATDEFLLTLDSSLTENLKTTNFDSKDEQISTYQRVISSLLQQKEILSKFFKTSKEQISAHNETITLQNQSISALKATINKFPQQPSQTGGTFDLTSITTLGSTGTSLGPIGTMNIEAKDVITVIPVFSGDQKELDTFENTCDLYDSLITENAQKTTLLAIIKANIRGEALAKWMIQLM